MDIQIIAYEDLIYDDLRIGSSKYVILHLFMLAKVLKNELDLSFDTKTSRYGQNSQANS